MEYHMKRFIVSILLIACGFCHAAGKYNIGVYYFPGWKDGVSYGAGMHPWELIKPYADREPLKGWYAEGESSIALRQMIEMAGAGINYVVYDTYWRNGHTFMNHALDAYLKVTNPSKKSGLNYAIKFSILWCNHDDDPLDVKDFDAMINYWIDRYLSNPMYEKLNNAPKVFVFSMEQLDSNAEKSGTTTKALFDRAQNLAKKKGLPGIAFVAGLGAGMERIKKADASGYSAYSLYNFHTNGDGQFSVNYTELDKGYQTQWKWMLNNAPKPYILPVTAGWNKKPWGGSSVKEHDNSVSTPESFTRHLSAARDFLNAHKSKEVIICCWNEFGEGSYIEPTKKWGTQYLDSVKRVFGK